MRRLLLTGLLVLGLAAQAHAQSTTSTSLAVQTFSPDIMASCSSGCSTGVAGTNSVTADGSAALYFWASGSGTLDAKVQQSLDGGFNWVDVNGQDCASGADTNCTNAGEIMGTNFLPINNPAGRYRINVTTCTSCTYIFRWYAVNTK